MRARECLVITDERGVVYHPQAILQDLHVGVGGVRGSGVGWRSGGVRAGEYGREEEG